MGETTAGFHNVADNGGFFPEGLLAVFALTLGVIFAFGGTEMVGVAAGLNRHQVPAGGIIITSASGRWTLGLFALVVALMVAGWYTVRGRIRSDLLDDVVDAS